MSAAAPPAVSRRLLGIALVLPLVLIVGVLVAAAMVRGQRPAPLPLPAVATPKAHSADCARLLAALPQDLEGDTTDNDETNDRMHRRQLAAPAPPGAAAWGEPPVAVHCGVARPDELTTTSRLLDVSGVRFLALPAAAPPGDQASGWIVVDRPVHVLVTLPSNTGSGALQQIAEVVGQTLPHREVPVAR